MIWPPVKAWTSKVYINGQVHFVAINYGGELLSRWVVFMSVADSSVVIKVSWSNLVDLSSWETGWDERNLIDSSEIVCNKSVEKAAEFYPLSIDSGLTIPISQNIVRPWFDKL
jgi:tryptophan-rich hypothetical protein